MTQPRRPGGWRPVSAVALALPLVAASLPTPTATAAPPRTADDRIDLPTGWQPEGVTTDGDLLYVGSLVHRAAPPCRRAHRQDDGAAQEQDRTSRPWASTTTTGAT